MDLAEEISANFEALPFAMASDSDNDAGASVTSDSGSHGPPCRIAAVAVAQQRMFFVVQLTFHLCFDDLYSFSFPVLFFVYFSFDTEYISDLSCHYKVELSYENLVTSGPDSHPPPIADDESDDEDDDDAPRVNTVLTCLNEVEQIIMLVHLITFYLGLSSGGPLCSSGEGLGNKGIPYDP